MLPTAIKTSAPVKFLRGNRASKDLARQAVADGVIDSISPVRSATGINCAGVIEPNEGLCHLASASNPMVD